MAVIIHFLTFYIFVCLSGQIYGWPDGAPDSECKELTPHHGDKIFPQKTPFPYNIVVNKTEVSPGEEVIVTISGNDTNTFKGFLVQGRKADKEKDTDAVGAFKVDKKDKTKKYHGLKCGDVENSSVTHNNNKDKKSIELTWIAPKEKGVYILTCTIVKDLSTFWVNYSSQNITVT